MTLIIPFAQSLGPLALSLDLNGDAIRKAENTANSPGEVYYTSQAAARAQTLRNEKGSIQRSFEVAKTNLDEVRRDVAEQVGRTLVDDVHKYQNALEELIASDEAKYGQLEELVASIANTKPVQAGQLAMVPFDDKMQKAKVQTVGVNGQVTVSIWVDSIEDDYGRYQEGYDTSAPVIESFPRQHVYTLGQKDRQTLTSSVVSTVVSSSADPDRLKKFLKNTKRPEFLMGLYADAAETKARLTELGNAVETRVNGPLDNTKKVEAKVPSLKGIARATVKTKEKYGGNFDRLTDLARMTFICEDAATVMAVLTFIRGNAQWTILRIKDRLHRQHDASATGGYRDMLLNVQDNTSGHIAEIQITFRRFFTIKSGGGHAVYKLARLLELNEEQTTYFMGKIDESIVEKIGAGLIDRLSEASESGRQVSE